MMSNREPEIPDELLYRQIGSGGDPIYFASDRIPPVHRRLFIPNPADVDGLSMIRSAYRSRVWSAYRIEKPEARHRLVDLLSNNLVEIGKQVGISDFSIEPTKDTLDREHGKPIAHCVARSINRPDYDSSLESKKRMKEWALQVADSISLDDIHGPYPPPTVDDAYRPNSK